MNTKLPQIIAEIQADIQLYEQDITLYEEDNFDSRTNAIDFIDFHILDRIASLQQLVGQHEQLDVLKKHAEDHKNKLEEINAELFAHLKEQIRIGGYTQPSFQMMIGKYFGDHFFDGEKNSEIGYNNLDIFINGILMDETIPTPTIEPQPEMVFYQQTPAKVIFNLITLAKVTPNDVFYDLGSGLGHVVILLNLISGAVCKGIEYEPAYCNYAQACALNLNLLNVEFINSDARNADLILGTVFFMYTPFEGSIMREVLTMLQKEVSKRTIRIFTYGPCSVIVAKETWLACLNGQADDIYKLYEFSSLIF
jgi:SAM-dependent methyltransferase